MRRENSEMEGLTDLYQWLYREGVMLFARPLPFSANAPKSVSIRLNQSGAWGIFLDADQFLDTRDEYSTMLHECGHYATGTTHAVSSPSDLVARHENRADKWAIAWAVPADELETAVKEGCTEIWDLAERFHVTEDFMKKAVCWYRNGNLAAEMYL